MIIKEKINEGISMKKTKIKYNVTLIFPVKIYTVHLTYHVNTPSQS